MRIETKGDEMTPLRPSTVLPIALAVATGALATMPASAAAARDALQRRASTPLQCAQLATDAGGIVGAPGIKTVTAAVIAASGSNKAYCQVNILYGESDAQNINIRVGLPLNTADGGSGAEHGAWNGRTQGIGGGGCSGSLAVNAPVNA